MTRSLGKRNAFQLWDKLAFSVGSVLPAGYGTWSTLREEDRLKMLQNPKVHNRPHKSQPLFSVLSQMNPFHIIQSCLFKIRINIVLQSTPVPSKSFHPFCFFFRQFLYAFHISHKPPPIASFLILVYVMKITNYDAVQYAFLAKFVYVLFQRCGQ